MRCTLVYPVFRGFTWVKYTDDPDWFKLWHKAYERCRNEATTEVLQQGYVVHRCDDHKGP